MNITKGIIGVSATAIAGAASVATILNTTSLDSNASSYTTASTTPYDVQVDCTLYDYLSDNELDGGNPGP